MDANIILESFYYLTKKLKAPIDKLAAIKMLFFADRYHLRKYGRLISDDTYYALPHGPVASNALDIINLVLNENNTGTQKQYIKKDLGTTFSAVDTEYELDYLSDSDEEALDFVIAEFGDMKAWDLRDLTHEYPEWKRYKQTLESQSSRRELIIMSDFFEEADIDNDPFVVIPKRAVELSKELYSNY
ncbi:MAG: SocA family protein [Sulfurimonas sp.]|nr:SocA family protein [Sulfurimonas sp.]